jgi:hypothetical protein
VGTRLVLPDRVVIDEREHAEGSAGVSEPAADLPVGSGGFDPVADVAEEWPAAGRCRLDRSRSYLLVGVDYLAAHTSSVARCAASTESNRPTVVIGENPGGSSSRWYAT